jgi:hypothetical protein
MQNPELIFVKINTMFPRDIEVFDRNKTVKNMLRFCGVTFGTLLL